MYSSWFIQGHRGIIFCLKPLASTNPISHPTPLTKISSPHGIQQLGKLNHDGDVRVVAYLHQGTFILH